MACLLPNRQGFLVACLILLCLLAGCASALTFGVIGDWGTGGAAAHAVSGVTEPEIVSVKAYNKYCQKFRCNFTISCGDNIYVGNVMQGIHDSFEAMYGPQTGPFFPSVGNHDNAGPQIGYTKKNPKWRFDSRYYSYKLPIDNTGYAVEIFAVDTTDGSLGGGAQYHWLENKLHESDARWKFIFGHYPLMGSGRHKRVGTVFSIPKLMRKYSAQAYFFGHDHLVEVSNDQGAIHGLSGGMSRGGMMWRGIGGATRRFSLTSPPEYSKYKQDWPNWGFHLCHLSPNVMSCQVIQQYDFMGYEYTVTHDWLNRTQPPDGSKSEIPEKARTQWPSGREIKKALKDEVNLPVGDQVKDAVKVTLDTTTGKVAEVSKAPTKPPTTLAPGQTTTAAPATTAYKATLSKELLAATHPPNLANINHPAVFSVSTECEGCRSTHPVANQPFTVTIQDIDVWSDANHNPKIYLSSSPTGCHDTVDDKRMILPGTEVYDMKKNTKVFSTTIGRATSVYVCFDDGRGYAAGERHFMNLKRINDPGEPHGFMLESPIAVAPLSAPLAVPGSVPAAPGAPAATPMPGLVGTTPPASTPAPASSDGHSSLTLIVVAVVCLGAGFGFSVYQKSQNSNGGAHRVARDEN